MATDRWRQIEDIFIAAAELNEPTRRAFLDSKCGGDAGLRKEVERLLAADRGAAASLAAAVGGSLRALDSALAPGQRIGPYEILGLIGQGGMGRVYHARRSDEVFSKEVAIKVVMHPTDAFVRRFQRERRILARLEHAAIARVLDGGSTEDGLPYLVMEYVDGPNLLEFASDRHLDLEARLRLFLLVCEAVEHAHQNQIVHRDLKPSNILVDRQGRPRLLDFGIAKLMEDGGHVGTATAAGHGMLTPRYSSPEQVKGEPVTTASDVYSLGVLLYELITGCAAHRISGGSPAAVVKAVCDDEIPVPSQAARQAVEHGSAVPVPPEQLTADLDRIVFMTVEKDPHRRYRSVQALADDIGRHLEAVPVSAGRLDARAFGLARRHPLTATIALALIMAASITAAYLTTRSRSSSAGAPVAKVMLAVLPLENLTGREDQEYFVDGLHEEILSRLGRLRPDRLGVIARTSVLQYKGSKQSIAAIGKALGVQYVLESSVRQAAERIRVTAQLIQVSDQTHLWADTYEREYGDVFSVQADIGAHVADSLELDVLPQAFAAAGSDAKLSPEAHVAYLRGNYFYQRRSLNDPTTILRALDHFENVIALAPNFAEGHVSLSRVYSFQALYAPPPERQTLRMKAEAALAKALALDDQLASVHTSLARIRFSDWDWTAAERGYRDAIRLDPNSAGAHQSLATLLAFTGRHQEADHEARLAQELDPISPTVHEAVFYIQLAARRWEQAEATVRKLVDLTAGTPQPVYLGGLRSLLLALQGDCRSALAEFARVQSPTAEPNGTATGYAPAYVFGRCEKPENVARRAKRTQEQSQPYAHTIAVLYAGSGDRANALEWLEEAYRRHEATVNFVAVDPTLDSLRREPRFQVLLERIGLHKN